MARRAGGLSVVAFAITIVLVVILTSYAAGYIVGKLVLGTTAV